MMSAPIGLAATPPVLSDLPVGTRVQDLLIVLDVEARGGDTPHTILTLGNASGRLPSAPFWPSDRSRLVGVGRGQVVEVTGVVSSYRDRRQLAVESLRVVPGAQVDWHRLMPSVGNVTGLWALIDGWRAGLGTGRLARTVGLFFDDPDFRERYEQCPASLGGPHAKLGGLLLHTVEVVRIARAIARQCHGPVDHDLVLAGSLLHDIGKVESYRWQGSFEMTVPGAVMGHVVLGAMMLDRRVRAFSPSSCTDDELLILHHLLLSHHGRMEFGAPVQPMTLEAEILHHADNASAKAGSMSEALREDEHFPDGASVSPRGIWRLDRRRAWRASSDWGAATAG